MNRHFQKLNEADYVPVSLSDRDMMDPDSVSLKGIAKKAKTDADEAERKEAERVKRAQVAEKYKDVKQIIANGLENTDRKNEAILDDIFDILVPRDGKADTVAGEIVRAAMRLLYRSYNDGDKFFEGYGLETCAPSMAYLIDTVDEVADYVAKMLDQISLYIDDSQYDAALDRIVGMCLRYILNNFDECMDLNVVDSRDYSGSTLEYIEDNQPMYEYEIYASDDVETLVDNNILNAWDLKNYVEEMIEWESAFKGAEVSTPWNHDSTSLTIENLTKDGYELMNDWFDDRVESFWEDLVNEYRDELDAIENGDDSEDEEDYEDEDIDESLKDSQYDDQEDIAYTKDIVKEYFKDIEYGYGYVTVDKAVDDLSNKDILVDEEAVIEYADEFNYPVMNFEDIQVILTSSAPSRKEIAAQLGVEYDHIDESQQFLNESARPGHDRILYALDNNTVDSDTLLAQLLRWCRDDDLVKFADSYGYGNDLNEDTINVHLVPDNIAPDHLVGDIHLDASGQSVGIAGGTGGTVSNTGHTSNSTNNTKRISEPAKK